MNEFDVNYDDGNLEEWIEAQIQAHIEKRERRREKNNFVINLSKPKHGDIFRFFEDEIWIVEEYISYGEVIQYNQGLLILRELKGKRLYTVPHRINGNLERRTLHRLPEIHLKRLKYAHSLEISDSDIPFDVQVVCLYTGLSLNEVRVERDSNHYKAFIPYLDITANVPGRGPTSWESFSNIFDWIIKCVGCITVDKVFFALQRFSNDWLFGDAINPPEGQRIHGIYPIRIAFDLLPDTPKPDATLIDHIPPKKQKIQVFPSDIERTARSLLKHFDADELISVIETMKD